MLFQPLHRGVWHEGLLFSAFLMLNSLNTYTSIFPQDIVYVSLECGNVTPHPHIIYIFRATPVNLITRSPKLPRKVLAFHPDKEAGSYVIYGEW